MCGAAHQMAIPICEANCCLSQQILEEALNILGVKCVTLRNPDVFKVSASYTPHEWPGNANILNIINHLNLAMLLIL